MSYLLDEAEMPFVRRNEAYEIGIYEEAAVSRRAAIAARSYFISYGQEERAAC